MVQNTTLHISALFPNLADEYIIHNLKKFEK